MQPRRTFKALCRTVVHASSPVGLHAMIYPWRGSAHPRQRPQGGCGNSHSKSWPAHVPWVLRMVCLSCCDCRNTGHAKQYTSATQPLVIAGFRAKIFQRHCCRGLATLIVSSSNTVRQLEISVDQAGSGSASLRPAIVTPHVLSSPNMT